MSLLSIKTTNKIIYKRGFVNMKDIYEKVLIGLIEVILVAGGIAIIALYG